MGNAYVKERPRALKRLKHDWKTFKPYDWKLAHSYTACHLFAVLGGRSIGKTYGLRLENIEDYWRKRWRFMEFARTKDELKDLEAGYFEKIEAMGEFPDLTYKVENHRAYIAKRPADDDQEPKWELAGYFMPLTAEQSKKRSSFFMVKNFTFDEAIIDRRQNPYARYIGNEYSTIMGYMNTALRETPDDPEKVARVQFIGNACELNAPCIRGMGVDTVPKVGRNFYGDGLAMLHRLDNRYSREFQEKTLVGQLMGLSDYGNEQAGVFFDNEFQGEYSEFIEEKTKDARLSFVLVFERRFGIWMDLKRGLVYVSKKAPKGAGVPEFALTMKDNRIDYHLLDRSSDLIKRIKSFVKGNLIRYEDAMTAADFENVLRFIGVL